MAFCKFDRKVEMQRKLYQAAAIFLAKEVSKRSPLYLHPQPKVFALTSQKSTVMYIEHAIEPSFQCWILVADDMNIPQENPNDFLYFILVSFTSCSEIHWSSNMQKNQSFITSHGHVYGFVNVM